MAINSPAKQLQDELSCSLCHKYFTGPVSIHCGHSFCQMCITQLWEKQETDFCCPRCGEKSLSREVRPSKELGVIVPIAKQMKSEMEQSVSGEKLCEMHQKSLKFFCKDEQKLMCLSCTGSEDHTGHILVSVEDAAEDYKQKLQIHLQALIEEREKALAFQKRKEYSNNRFLENAEDKKQKFVSKFEELEIFLKEQKKSMLDQLDELVKKQEEFTTRLSSEIYVFDTLIHVVEEKCKQPASVFLQDVGETLSRNTTWKFQEPQDVPSELEEKLCALSKNYLILQENVQVFRETFPYKDEVKWVKVILDPDTAHPTLKVSFDQKRVSADGKGQRVTFCDGSDSPQHFTDTSCVLGCERFTSGRHYWEVQVERREANWAVGVATESVKRKETLSLNPREGIWVMRKTNKLLEADGITLNSKIPTTVGVFLDYRSNRVQFFDAYERKALYTFHPVSLQNKKIRPFFWLEGRGGLSCM